MKLTCISLGYMVAFLVMLAFVSIIMNVFISNQKVLRVGSKIIGFMMLGTIIWYILSWLVDCDSVLAFVTKTT